MKTITIEDDVYARLSEAKQSLHARSFSQVLRQVFSEDRMSWVHKLAGKVQINKKEIALLEQKWKAWHTQ